MTTLVCVFDTLSNAEEARRQLLESGLNLANVDIVSRDDEIAATQDDFDIESQSTAKPRSDNRHRRPISLKGGSKPYGNDFGPTVKHATVMMTVETQSDSDTSRARALIGRLGGTDIDFLTSPHHH